MSIKFINVNLIFHEFQKPNQRKSLNRSSKEEIKEIEIMSYMILTIRPIDATITMVLPSTGRELRKRSMASYMRNPMSIHMRRTENRAPIISAR